MARRVAAAHAPTDNTQTQLANPAHPLARGTTPLAEPGSNAELGRTTMRLVLSARANHAACWARTGTPTHRDRLHARLVTVRMSLPTGTLLAHRLPLLSWSPRASPQHSPAMVMVTLKPRIALWMASLARTGAPARAHTATTSPTHGGEWI